MAFRVYVLPLIDTQWEHLQTVEDITASLARHSLLGDPRSSSEFISTWESAQALAARHGWDGDFRTEPAVLWLPTASGVFDFGFVLKQDKNGTTYVVSPVPLPWLGDYESSE